MVLMRAAIAKRIDPEIVLSAYRCGFFPMAQSRNGPVSWFSPDPRAIIPLESFNIPRSLRKEMTREQYPVTIDKAFDEVIRECARERSMDETWISDEIVHVYSALHRMGFAHSVETWSGRWLCGGLYGVTIGGAFFGESMFSRLSNTSKIALVHLVGRLRERGYRLLDTQIINDHIRQFGAIEIPRAKYLELLESAISLPVRFTDVA